MNDSAKKLILAGCLVGTGLLTRQAVAEAWEEATGKDAPKNPAAQGVTWTHALMWTATASLTVGVARTVVRRLLAEGNDEEPLA